MLAQNAKPPINALIPTATVCTAAPPAILLLEGEDANAAVAIDAFADTVSSAVDALMAISLSKDLMEVTAAPVAVDSSLPSDDDASAASELILAYSLLAADSAEDSAATTSLASVDATFAMVEPMPLRSEPMSLKKSRGFNAETLVTSGAMAVLSACEFVR